MSYKNILKTRLRSHVTVQCVKPLTKRSSQHQTWYHQTWPGLWNKSKYINLKQLYNFKCDAMPEQVKHIEWEDMDKRKFYFFGPTLFLGLRVFLYPVNLIKTRLQVQRKNVLYKGTFDAFGKIVRTEGPRGLYKGFMVSCVGLLSGQCYITTYELVRAKTDGYSYAVRGFLAGGCASLVGQTITVPVDILSQKLMVQGQNQPQVKIKGASTIFREILQTHGPVGLYKGYFASLITYAPSSAIWWSAYGLYTGVVGNNVPSGTPHMFVLALSGSMAGATAATLTNPLDIVRTRLQVEGGTSMIGTFKTLLKQEGLLGMTKGLSARTTSMLSSSIIMVLGYETVKRLSLKTEEKLHSEVEEEGYLEAAF